VLSKVVHLDEIFKSDLIRHSL